MNQTNPNINISFEDGLSFDINEEEIIKNIDFVNQIKIIITIFKMKIE